MKNLIKKRVINLANVEVMEYILETKEEVNIKLTLVSGKIINNLYTDKEEAEKHYQELRKGFGSSVENIA